MSANWFGLKLVKVDIYAITGLLTSGYYNRCVLYRQEDCQSVTLSKLRNWFITAASVAAEAIPSLRLERHARAPICGIDGCVRSSYHDGRQSDAPNCYCSSPPPANATNERTKVHLRFSPFLAVVSKKSSFLPFFLPGWN